MTKEEIKRAAYYRMARIEECFTGYVPSDVQSYWLLNFLVANGPDAFLDQYGLLRIDREECRVGRESMGWGENLSPFEIDCINYLNEVIDRVQPARVINIR